MTELLITPNFGNKTAKFKGTIAGGESVKVTIVGAAKWLSSGLRLRVVCGCSKTVAMFPLKSEDGTVSSFEVVGDDLIAAPLELNTIQARFYTQGLATTAATFIVEDLENNILYFQDSYELHGWVKRDGDEEPYDLTKFPELIEDWRKQIESLIVDAKEVDGGIEVTICDGVSPAKTLIIRNGRDGQPGEPGRKGEDGKSLKFSDLTEAQKAELKGAKGDTGDGITDELKALPNKVTENAQAIEANRVAVNTEENRAKGAEKELLTRIEESKANAAAAMTAASKAQDTADRTVTEIATLVGDDAGDKRKSARQIAAEEVAKVIAGADTNYDTLKEIADYIKSDATDAAQLKNKVTNLEANKADNTALTAEVSRAKGAEAALDGRVKELEENAGDSSVEVVAPSPDGEGKAADAKAVYEELEKKRDLGNRDYVVKVDPIKETQDSRFVIYDASGTDRLTLNRAGETWVGDPSNIYIQFGDNAAPPIGTDTTYLFFIRVKQETRQCLVYKPGCLSYSAEVTLDSNYYAEVTVEGVAIKIKGVTEVTDSFALKREIPDLSGYAKTTEVPAAIAGKEIKPSKVSTTSDGVYVASSADNPFYVQSTKNNTNISANLSVIESEVDVRWSIFAAALGGAITTADYSGRKIFLGYNDREKEENRRFTLSVETGTVSYSGPEGEAENTIANMVNAMPRYPFVDAAIVDGAVTVAPYTNAKLVSDGTAFTVAVGGESGYMRDCVLRVECGETAPTITWGANFHPRTDAGTDFACVAGVRNVYWITEHAPNEFTVAGWQETEGGSAE